MFKSCSHYLLLVFSAVVTSALLIPIVGYSAASADGLHHFRFVTLSAASITDRINFIGDGEFNSVAARGSGSYTEFNPSVGSPPFPIISAGTWHVTQFLSFTSPGAYGDVEAGILVVRVTLIQNLPTAAQIPAVLSVFCHLAFANLDVGHEEGIQLMEKSKTFTQFAGFTAFSTTPE